MRRSCSSPPPSAVGAWTRATGRPWRSPCGPSPTGGVNRTPGWELRGRLWTHSRLICVAGLRAVAAAALRRSPPPSTRGHLHRPGRHAPRRRRADLPPPRRSLAAHARRPVRGRRPAAARIRGALPAADPRTRATLAACRRELADDHFLYRFRHNERPPGRGRGRFRAVRVRHGARRAPAGPDRRGVPLVRTRPGGACGSRGCTPRSSTSPSVSCAATSRMPSCTR